MIHNLESEKYILNIQFKMEAQIHPEIGVPSSNQRHNTSDIVDDTAQISLCSPVNCWCYKHRKDVSRLQNQITLIGNLQNDVEREAIVEHEYYQQFVQSQQQMGQLVELASQQRRSAFVGKGEPSLPIPQGNQTSSIPQDNQTSTTLPIPPASTTLPIPLALLSHPATTTFRRKCRLMKNQARSKARKFTIIYVVFLFISTFINTFTGAMSFYWPEYSSSITAFVNAAICILIFILKLGPLSETYSSIALQFLYLEKSGTGKQVDEEKYKLLCFQMKSAVLSVEMIAQPKVLDDDDP